MNWIVLWRKSWFTNLGSNVWKTWMIIGVGNAAALLVRFILMICLLKDSGGSFDEAPDLPALLTAIDGAAAIVSAGILFSFNEDLSKLRLFIKYITMILIAESGITGAVAIHIMKTESGIAATAYYRITIASCILNAIFLFFLVQRYLFVGASHVFLSHKWSKTDKNDGLYHERVAEVQNKLAEMNVIPWIDNREIMIGDQTNKSLVHGIIRSQIIIFFITEEFCEDIANRNLDKACCFEFTLARALEKNYIIVYFDKFATGNDLKCEDLTKWMTQHPPLAKIDMSVNETLTDISTEALRAVYHETWRAQTLDKVKEIAHLIQRLGSDSLFQSCWSRFLKFFCCSPESDHFSPVLIHDVGNV